MRNKIFSIKIKQKRNERNIKTITTKKNRKNSNKQITKNIKLKGGAYSLPKQYKPKYYDNVDNDKHIKFVIAHGAIVMTDEYQFDLPDGYNVIYMTGLGNCLQVPEDFLQKFFELIIKKKFNIESLYDLPIDYKKHKFIHHEQLKKDVLEFIDSFNIRIPDELAAGKKKLIDLYLGTRVDPSLCRYIRELNFQGIIDLINSVYTTKDISFRFHVGGEGRKCNDLLLNYEDIFETGLKLGICKKLVNHEVFNENFETPTDDITSVKELIFKYGKGTYIFNSCREIDEDISEEDKSVMREISTGTKITDMKFDKFKVFCSCRFIQCDGIVDIEWSNFFCKKCKKSYCNLHKGIYDHFCPHTCHFQNPYCYKDTSLVKCFIDDCHKYFCLDHLEKHIEEEHNDGRKLKLYDESNRGVMHQDAIQLLVKQIFHLDKKIEKKLEEDVTGSSIFELSNLRDQIYLLLEETLNSFENHFGNEKQFMSNFRKLYFTRFLELKRRLN